MGGQQTASVEEKPEGKEEQGTGDEAEADLEVAEEYIIEVEKE